MSHKQVFNILPKVIEDMIYEFNAEHRELMQPVLLDLVSFHTCISCDMPICFQDNRSNDYDFCSSYCYWGGKVNYVSP